MRGARLAPLLLAVGLSCGRVERVPPPDTRVPDPSPPATRPYTSTLEPTPEYALELRRLAGKRVVLLFWSPSSWLEPWLAGLNRIHRDFAAHDVEVIALSLYHQGTALQESVARMRPRFRIFETAARNREWFAAVGARSYPRVVLIDAKGDVVHGAHPGPWLEKALLGDLSERPTAASEPPSSAVAARVKWAGHPAAEILEGRPSAWFRDEWRNAAPGFEIRWDAEESVVKIDAVPEGTYLVEISGTGRAPDAARYSGTTTFGASDAEPARVEVALSRIMRLSEPVDTSRTLPAMGQLLTHASPVRFVWSPVPEADSYKVQIVRRRGGVEYDSAHEKVLERELSATSLSVPLEDGWDYELGLQAHGRGARIGHLEVKGENFRGWDYRFRVGPLRAERE